MPNSRRAGVLRRRGKATAATLGTPAGLALDGMGALYFADMDNLRIRVIDPSGTITTFCKG